MTKVFECLILLSVTVGSIFADSVHPLKQLEPGKSDREDRQRINAPENDGQNHPYYDQGENLGTSNLFRLAIGGLQELTAHEPAKTTREPPKPEKADYS